MTAVLGGSTIALALGAISGAPLGVDVAVGAVVAVAGAAALMHYTRTRYGMAASFEEALFPSPGPRA